MLLQLKPKKASASSKMKRAPKCSYKSSRLSPLLPKAIWQIIVAFLVMCQNSTLNGKIVEIGWLPWHEDNYGRIVKWEASLLSPDEGDENQFKQIIDTMLLDRDHCLFQTNFGLEMVKDQDFFRPTDLLREKSENFFNSLSEQMLTEVIEADDYGTKCMQSEANDLKLHGNNADSLQDECKPVTETDESSQKIDGKQALDIHFKFESYSTDVSTFWIPQLHTVGDNLLKQNLFGTQHEPSYNVSISWSNQYVHFLRIQTQNIDYSKTGSQIGLQYQLRSCGSGQNFFDQLCSVEQIATGLAGSATFVMSADEQNFELPVISECFHFSPIIHVSHDYTGSARDISAELRVSDQFSRLYVKDNGVSVNEAVNFSILASSDWLLKDQSSLQNTITIAFCKAPIERIEINPISQDFKANYKGANKNFEINSGQPLSITAYSKGDISVPSACLDSHKYTWTISDASGEWLSEKAVELKASSNAPKMLHIPDLAETIPPKKYAHKISVVDASNEYLTDSITVSIIVVRPYAEQETSATPLQEQRALSGDSLLLSACHGVDTVIIQETPTSSFDLDQDTTAASLNILASAISLTAKLFDSASSELDLPSCAISWSLVVPVSDTSLNSLVSLDSPTSPSKLEILDLSANSIQAGTYSFNIMATTAEGTQSPTKLIDINVCHVLQTFQILGTVTQTATVEYSGTNPDVPLRSDLVGSALATELLDITNIAINSDSTYCNTVISEVTWTFYSNDSTLNSKISFDDDSSPAYLKVGDLSESVAGGVYPVVVTATVTFDGLEQTTSTTVDLVVCQVDEIFVMNWGVYVFDTDYTLSFEGGETQNILPSGEEVLVEARPINDAYVHSYCINIEWRLQQLPEADSSVTSATYWGSFKIPIDDDVLSEMTLNLGSGGEGGPVSVTFPAFNNRMHVTKSGENAFEYRLIIEAYDLISGKSDTSASFDFGIACPTVSPVTQIEIIESIEDKIFNFRYTGNNQGGISFDQLQVKINGDSNNSNTTALIDWSIEVQTALSSVQQEFFFISVYAATSDQGPTSVRASSLSNSTDDIVPCGQYEIYIKATDTCSNQQSARVPITIAILCTSWADVDCLPYEYYGAENDFTTDYLYMPEVKIEETYCSVDYWTCTQELNTDTLDLCSSTYFDSNEGRIDVLSSPAALGAIQFPVHHGQIRIEPVVSDTVYNPVSPAYCAVYLTSDPCKAALLQQMKTKNPFPFSDKLYRLNEADLVVADWNQWSEIVDSSLGDAQCYNGYGITFHVSRDDDPTQAAIGDESSHEAFTYNVQFEGNQPGSLIFKQTNDFQHVGLWKIHYSLHLNSQTCQTETNPISGNLQCQQECTLYPTQCTEDCQGAQHANSCKDVYHRPVMVDIKDYETDISDEYMSLQVVPECTNTMYNQFIQHVNATSTIQYAVGSGPLSIPYPPETFSNTWYSGCGNITASLTSYDAAIASLQDDSIVIETAQLNRIGQNSLLYFDCWLVWDDIQLVPDPFIMTIEFVESLDEDFVSQHSEAGIDQYVRSEQELVLKILGSTYFSIAGSAPSVTFNIKEAQTSFTETVKALGQLVYESPFEDDKKAIVYTSPFQEEYSVRIQQDESSSFIGITQDEDDGSYWVKVDIALAISGEYTTEFIVQDLDSNGELLEQTIEIQTIIVDSELQTEDDLELDEDEDSSQETNSDSNGVNFKEQVDTSTFTKAKQTALSENWTAPQIEEYNDKIKKPVCTKISSSGTLDLIFDELRLLELEQQDLASSINRRLQSNQIASEDRQSGLNRIQGAQVEGTNWVQGIEIYIELSDSSDPDMLQFQFKTSNFDTEKLSLELLFVDPDHISYNPEPETLIIKLIDFRDPNGNLIVEEQEIQKTLPTQMDPGLASVIEAAGATAAASSAASMSLNFILNIVMSTSFNQMLSAIKNVQIIVHLTLLSVVVPANAQLFYGAIAEMVAFDPVELDMVLDLGFKARPDDDYDLDEDQECESKEVDESTILVEIEIDGDHCEQASDEEGQASARTIQNFIQLGYESKNFLVNLGGLRFIIMLQVAYIIVILILALVPWCCGRVRNWFNNKVGGIFFNALITFVDSTFLVIGMQGLLNVREVYSDRYHLDAGFVWSILAISVLLVELIGVSVFLRRNRNKLDQESKQKRCGYIFEDLNYKIRGGWTLSYPVLYQIRLAVLAICTIFMGNYLVVQVLAVTLCSILITAVLGSAHPYKIIRNNYKEIGNESVIILIIDLLLFSSDPSVRPAERSYIGFAMIGVLCISLCFSQGALLIATFIKVKLSCKRRIHKRRKKNLQKLQRNRVEQITENIRNMTARLKDNQIDEEGGQSGDMLDLESDRIGLKKSHLSKRSRQKKLSLEADDTVQAFKKPQKSSAFLDRAVSPDMIKSGAKLPKIDETVERDDSDEELKEGLKEGQCIGCLMRQGKGKCVLCQLKDDKDFQPAKKAKVSVEQIEEESKAISLLDISEEVKETSASPLKLISSYSTAFSNDAEKGAKRK